MVSTKDYLLGQQIQKLRRQRDLKQAELAERVKLSEKYVQLIENGKRTPSLRALYKIASAFNVKVSDLFTF